MISQQGMVPYQGFGGGFGQGMSPMGGGLGPMGGGFGVAGDPTSVNNGMMALGQQQLQWNGMMEQMMTMMGMIFNMFMLKQMQAMVSAMANFGGGAAAAPGVGNFLGGGGGKPGAGAPSAPTATGRPGAPTATSSDFGSVPAWGSALARDAEKHANGPGGYCYKWVCQALARAGVKGIGGASAYMGADQLAKNPRFREISVQPKDLAKLPAGAVVVWNRGAGHPHGHISIALGDGREASDKIRKQITNYGTSVRVFLPK